MKEEVREASGKVGEEATGKVAEVLAHGFREVLVVVFLLLSK